jgi:hypothetical protein
MAECSGLSVDQNPGSFFGLNFNRINGISGDGEVGKEIACMNCRYWSRWYEREDADWN